MDNNEQQLKEIEEWRKDYLESLAEYKEHLEYFRNLSKRYVLSDTKTHSDCIEIIKNLKKIRKDLVNEYETRFRYPISQRVYPRVEGGFEESKKQARNIFG